VRLSSIGLCGLLTLVSVDGPPRSDDAPAGASASIERFLAQRETPLTSAVARRHLVATTGGGTMSGWIDACTFLEGSRMRYAILAQGGSGAVRKRALIAALDGEVKARRDGDPGRASLLPANYEFTPADPSGEVLRIKLTPKRKDSMLIDGSMTLARDGGEFLSVEGRLVKSPSFWTRQVHVTRRYARIAGVRVPVSMQSEAKVLVVGASTFEMSYSYLTINGAPVGGAATDAERACATPAAPADVRNAAPHNERAVAFHLRRSLDEASAEYAAALEIDPPRPPTAAELGLAERFAPRVFVTGSEPFALRDVAVVLHPTQPVIAYHFFWDDDIDYPDDNEPSDHEVVWVRYRPDGALDRLWTYFHGRILDGGEAAKQDAAAHDMRPAVMVQWGKHGSMPIGWETLSIEAEAGETESSYYPVGVPITLERYNQGTFRKLSTEGARAAGNPLAVRDGWPRTFTGSWEDFSRFDRPVDVLGRLQATSMVIVSRWNSASINQRFLRYNFRPKTEWPVEGW
jgi:hypothetical protein